jgi:hypothetical protein
MPEKNAKNTYALINSQKMWLSVLTDNWVNYNSLAANSKEKESKALIKFKRMILIKPNEILENTGRQFMIWMRSLAKG